MFQQLGVKVNGIYEQDFLKIAVLDRSTKGAMTGSGNEFM